MEKSGTFSHYQRNDFATLKLEKMKIAPRLKKNDRKSSIAKHYEILPMSQKRIYGLNNF